MHPLQCSKVLGRPYPEDLASKGQVAFDDDIVAYREPKAFVDPAELGPEAPPDGAIFWGIPEEVTFLTCSVHRLCSILSGGDCASIGRSQNRSSRKLPRSRAARLARRAQTTKVVRESEPARDPRRASSLLLQKGRAAAPRQDLWRLLPPQVLRKDKVAEATRGAAKPKYGCRRSP